jgi:hypothetical protein
MRAARRAQPSLLLALNRQFTAVGVAASRTT